MEKLPIQTPDIARTYKGLSDARKELRQASNLNGAAQMDSAHLKSFSSAQTDANGGITEPTTEVRQVVELQVLREQAVHKKHVEATDKVLNLEQSLKAALHMQGFICTVNRPHNCHFLLPSSKATYINLEHRFWKFQSPSSAMKTGPYGFAISNNRVTAFRSIKENTGSELGNGTSGLHTSIDVDGVLTEHGPAATEAETKDDPIDSWGLMREHFRQEYLKKRKERAEERDRVTNFRDWCIGIHAVHGELYDKFLRFDTMPPFDLEPLIELYGKGYRFTNKMAY